MGMQEIGRLALSAARDFAIGEQLRDRLRDQTDIPLSEEVIAALTTEQILRAYTTCVCGTPLLPADFSCFDRGIRDALGLLHEVEKHPCPACGLGVDEAKKEVE